MAFRVASRRVAHYLTYSAPLSQSVSQARREKRREEKREEEEELKLKKKNLKQLFTISANSLTDSSGAVGQERKLGFFRSRFSALSRRLWRPTGETAPAPDARSPRGAGEARKRATGRRDGPPRALFPRDPSTAAWLAPFLFDSKTTTLRQSQRERHARRAR